MDKWDDGGPKCQDCQNKKSPPVGMVAWPEEGDACICIVCLRERFRELESALEKATNGGCAFALLRPGNCETEVGLPGRSVPGQHDGDDDTVDANGKPNGWCWSCWKTHEQGRFHEELEQVREEAETWRRRWEAVRARLSVWEQEDIKIGGE